MPALHNPRQELFAQGVSSGLSQTKAYIIAGYSQKTAKSRSSVLATKYPEVASRIQALTEEKAQKNEVVTKLATEKLAIDRAWVLRELVDNVQSAKAAVPVLDRGGNAIGEYRRDLGAANKALELLGKELGMFVDRKVAVKSPIDALSFEEKKALLEVLDEIIATKRKQLVTTAINEVKMLGEGNPTY